MVSDLDLVISQQTVTADAYRSDYLAFAATPSSDLHFFAPSGDYEALSGGTLHHRGGFVFRLGTKRLSLRDFQLVSAEPEHNFLLLDRRGNVLFYVDHAHPYLNVIGTHSEELLLLNMDLLIAPWFAEWLGRPDLEGAFLGAIDVALEVNVPDGFTEGQCTPDFTGDVDVLLSTIGNLSQFAREAGGRVAVSATASLSNVGTADVPWYRAIFPDGGVPPEEIGQHPYLVLHFYHIHNGVLEQLGRSDVKHAFFSVNSGCPCPGGQVLYVGCGDTYGASTNANRFYLAPREELTASIGHWKSRGSHFDGDPIDDVRDHGSSGHDNFEHRLFVQESELQDGSSSFFIEAWYVVQGDINIFNNIGYRQAIPNFTGKAWSFSFIEPNRTLGATIDAWVAPDSLLANESNNTITTVEGHLQVATKVTDLGNGTHHYEYALMNLDFDRQINSFSVPLNGDVSVFNGSSGRLSEGSGWQMTVTPTEVTWQAPATTGLDWGTLYNFRFDANAPSESASATLGALEPGPFPTVNGTVLAPSFCLTTQSIMASYPTWFSKFTVLDLVDMVNVTCAQ